MSKLGIPGKPEERARLKSPANKNQGTPEKRGTMRGESEVLISREAIMGCTGVFDSPL